MSARQFAFLSGAIFLLVGLLQLAPGLSTFPPSLPRLNLEISYGLFLNTFPVNIINKLALIIIGIAGLAISRSKDSEAMSIMYSRVVCIVMGVAAVLGVIPQTQTFFGYWPLFGAEVWFHGIAAAISAYFGFAKKEVEVKRQTFPATPTTRVY